jgi:hypothetical protein
VNDCDVTKEIDELFDNIEELGQLIFEARARHHIREYCESGWITHEQAKSVLTILGEPCL